MHMRYQWFLKICANLKRHNRVYVLSSKHTYRPMRAWVVAQIFYNISYFIIIFILLLAKHTDTFNSIWIPSSGSQLFSWCPGSAFFFFFLSVNLQRNTPLEECSSEVTPLKRLRLSGMKAAISGVLKKSPVKATILSLAIKSASWTIGPRKRDLQILSRIREGSTWNGQKAEVHFNDH